MTISRDSQLDWAAVPQGFCREDALYCSERTQVCRLHFADGAGSIVCKVPLGPHALERLRHERRILERLAGISGVPQLASLPHPANAIAMEDVGAIPLPEVMGCERLALPALLAVAQQLAQIIAAVHRAGVIHKDIHPANILLAGPQHQPLLTDFHLATTFAEEYPGFVHHGMIAGTLAYISPEQTGRTGRRVDQRADLYSFGATLYELATGRPPFPGDDPLQLIHDHLASIPAPPITLAPDLPPALSDIILRLLEKEPDRRYQSAEGLAHDLSRVLEGQTRGDDARFQLGQRDFALQLVPPSHLVGREGEIGALQAAFEDSLHGRKRGVLVAGDPGVGKTALINTLRPFVTTQRGWFISGKFDQLRQDQETDAVRQALRALGRLLLAEPEQVLAALRTKLLQALGHNTGLIAAALPEFALLLGPQPAVDISDLGKLEGRLIQAILDLLGTVVSPDRPLVMVIDDLQWAASTPISIVDAILKDENLRGLLIVGAYRAADVDATHPLSAMLSRWERLEMPPLGLSLQNLPPAGLSAFLAEMLRLPLTGEITRLADAVGMHTNGNPFDTVELVNALRREGLLLPGETGWYWDAAAIRHYVGQAGVIELLLARINRLPEQAQALLEIMACLGGELSLDMLRGASDLSRSALEAQLIPALDDGLLVMVQDGDDAVRFRHDRVQQAVHGRLDPASRCQLHLALARRLASRPGFSAAAAEQYLPAIKLVEDPDERRRVAELFRATTASLRQINYVMTENFAAAALALLQDVATPADAPLITALETERHLALYNLGHLEEADGIYRVIEGHCANALDLVEATCVQVNSLGNRGRPREAVALGLSLLRRLGVDAPAGDSVDTEVVRRLDALYQWVGHVSQAEDLQRPEVVNPHAMAIAALINRLMAPSRLCGSKILGWLVEESQQQWAEHGPCAKLAACLGHATLATIAMRGDYRTGYEAVRHVLAVCQARGYAPETSQVRDLFALSSSHWFEPLENSVALIQDAREGLLRGGDLQSTCFAYYVSITALLDCAPSLESYALEVETGLAFAVRTVNDHGTDLYLIYRQLFRSLRGQTRAPGSLTDGDYDEADRVGRLGENPSADATFHLLRALVTLLFGDMAGFAGHTALLVHLRGYLQSFYAMALVHLFQALAMAERIKTAAADERIALLAELDSCRDWLALRAADCSVNFLHLLKFVEAERAWALGDFQCAAGAFAAALREVAQHQRPWHRALIAERTGLFYLAHGMAHLGQNLLVEAKQCYEAWGTTAKVKSLEQAHPFLRDLHDTPRQRNSSLSGLLSADTIDMLSILRASQALSSETSLARLKARVVDLLGAMTGATTVRIALRDDSQAGWFLLDTDEEAGTPCSIEDAGAQGSLPLSAFRYVERTREPLLVEDAAHDDRFAHDPYFLMLERCSLLVVPILSQGMPRAILQLENRLSRGTFSVDRLDAVMLIAGQLAVSLDNALLYASLERRVAERTAALANSLSLLNATLESTADGILATQFSGEVNCANTKFRSMWGIPPEMHERGNDAELIAFIAPQTRHPEQFIVRFDELYAKPDAEYFDIIELQDGRIFERYCQPQWIDGKTEGVVFNYRDITERRRVERELEEAHNQLVATARQAGMAEIATNVLHNVGNVLNSVNVSANLVHDRMRTSKTQGLFRAIQMLNEHTADLGEFLTRDEKGKLLPTYLSKIAEVLAAEQQGIIEEVAQLTKSVDHIKEIVAAQQSYAGASCIVEAVRIEDLLEDALRMNTDALLRHQIEVVKEVAELPLLMLDKHRVLQILINLISNAKHAMNGNVDRVHQLILRVNRQDTQTLRIEVQDNGEGIAAENLTFIFSHGYTTRKDGHGFGLHSCILAAREMGGSLTVQSDGPGKGATFTLELPVNLAS